MAPKISACSRPENLNRSDVWEFQLLVGVSIRKKFPHGIVVAITTAPGTQQGSIQVFEPLLTSMTAALQINKFPNNQFAFGHESVWVSARWNR